MKVSAIRIVKDSIWKLSFVILWNISLDFPLVELSLWKQVLCYAAIFMSLDAIRWGLKD